jgi:cyclophilin family peptidyl-prolyl cis-trans isomerase
MTIDPNAGYEAEVATSCGTMLIRLLPKNAPIAVNNFVHLAQDDFYTGQIFHRIDPLLGVIQAGDPACPTSVQTCGTGGPGYTIKDEFHNGLTPHVGTVAMASAGTPNSSGSQFEIIAGKSQFQLPPERTIFGELVDRHSFQVAKLILSVPTKIAPNAPPDAPKDYPDGEFVYITSIKIIKKG